MKPFPLSAGLAAAVFALSLHAADSAGAESGATAAAATAEPIDPEEQLDDGFKRFGYLAGLARGCVKEEQRPTLEREALDLHSGISRLFGTDRAFLFTAAFGFGTSVSLEIKECEEVIAAYDQRVANFRAKSGGSKQ